jgi:hypothetical protein
MESVREQLFNAGSYKEIAFTRKYPTAGPIPENLKNYLDVRKKKETSFI